MKVYVEEVRPEFSESYFWQDFSETDSGTSYDGITILDYDGRWKNVIVKHTELFDRITEAADEITEAIEDFKAGNTFYYSPYKTFTEYITSILKPVKKFSTRQIYRLKTLFTEISDESNYYWVADQISEVMTIITGEKFNATALKGYCHGDCVTLIYKENEWSKEALESLETEYWNGGYAYYIHTEDDPGTTVYCYYTEWNDEKRTAEIAAEFGTSPENVIFV